MYHITWVFCFLAFLHLSNATKHYTVNEKTCFFCLPGTHWTDDCLVNGTHAQCRPCPEGTFQTTQNIAFSCDKCKTYCYERHEEIVQKCTPETDTVCKCESGYYYHQTSLDEGYCSVHTKCLPGHGVAKVGTAEDDTICETCVPGQSFSNSTSSDEPCQVCQSCPANTADAGGCDGIEDRLCHVSSSPSTAPSTEQGSIGGIIGGLVAVLLIAVVLVCIYCIYKKRYSQPDQKEINICPSCGDCCTCGNHMLAGDDLENKGTDSISDECVESEQSETDYRWINIICGWISGLKEDTTSRHRANSSVPKTSSNNLLTTNSSRSGSSSYIDIHKNSVQNLRHSNFLPSSASDRAIEQDARGTFSTAHGSVPVYGQGEGPLSSSQNYGIHHTASLGNISGCGQQTGLFVAGNKSFSDLNAQTYGASQVDSIGSIHGPSPPASQTLPKVFYLASDDQDSDNSSVTLGHTLHYPEISDSLQRLYVPALDGEGKDPLLDIFIYLSQHLISNNWKFFFRELLGTVSKVNLHGVCSDNVIDEVEIDCRNRGDGVQEILYQLFLRWRKIGGHEADMMKLIETLKTFERNDLVEDVESIQESQALVNKHNTSVETIV